MTRLTPAQIADAAARGGFHGKGLVRAVAVALAESGGNTQAVNVNRDKYRSRDRGLWQINNHWHPEVTDAAAFDPVSAAAHAYRISHGGTDWSAWSTWKHGTAQAQLGRARLAAHHVTTSPDLLAALGAAPGGNTTPDSGHWWGQPGLVEGFEAGLGITPVGSGALTVAGAVDGIDNTVEAAKAGLALAAKAGAWIADPHNWARVVMVAGGSAALVVALVMLAGGNPASVIPAGRVAAAAKSVTKKG